jgi:hypothetical protein
MKFLMFQNRNTLARENGNMVTRSLCMNSVHAHQNTYSFLLMLLFSALFVPALTFGQALEEQNTEVPKDPGSAKIFVIARSTANSVTLRWAPGTPRGWRLGNRIGFKIERKAPGGSYVTLNDTPRVAWMPETIIAAMEKNKDNKYLGMLLNALWSDTILIDVMGQHSEDTLQEVLQKNSMLYGYALLSADNDTLCAQAAGLRFVDYTVKDGEKYIYRVSLDTTVAYVVSPGEVAVTVGKNEDLNPPENVTALGTRKE